MRRSGVTMDSSARFTLDHSWITSGADGTTDARSHRMDITLRKVARIGNSAVLAFLFSNHCSPGTPEGEPPQNGVAQSKETKSASGGTTAAAASTPASCRNSCRKKYDDVSSFRDEWDACVKACAGDDGCSGECDGEYSYNCADAPDRCDAIDACFTACK